MTILVTGGTGTIGSLMLNNLSQLDVKANALTRNPANATLPTGINAVYGDMLKVDSIKTALNGVSTVFLLNTVSPQEFSEAVLFLNLAKEAGVKNVVYFSVFNADLFKNVPHFAAKFAVEQAISDLGFSASILRPNCFMQNDALYCKEALLNYSLYPFPIGQLGVSMVDTRDIADIATKTILAKAQSTTPLPNNIINIAGPDILTATSVAQMWSGLLNKEVKYNDSTQTFEQQMAQYAPDWLSMDMRLMLDRFHSDGMVASKQDVDTMQTLLGRPPRSYADFASECVNDWA